jgi:hypothetical protein
VPITQADAQAVTREFVRVYPEAGRLVYIFRETMTDLYGQHSGLPQNAKGAYLAKPTLHKGHLFLGQVHVALQNIDNANDLVASLRHEVLGHYGLNTFAPAERRALLDGIICSQNELQPLWDSVNRNYADKPLEIRAEEVFARHCEGIGPSLTAIVDQASQNLSNDHARRGPRAFWETCTTTARPIELTDLRDIASMVAQGLRDGSRTQQIFPHLAPETLTERRVNTVGVLDHFNAGTAIDTAAVVASLPPTQAVTEQEALVPAASLSDRLSASELQTRLAGSESVAESQQRLESAASAVFVNWQPIVKAVNDAALQGDRQVVSELRHRTESFGPLAGSDRILASRSDRRARHQALSSCPLLAAAAEHHIALVGSIKKTMEQEHNAAVRRASVEIARPSASLMAALAAGEALSVDLQSELQQTRSAFDERFGEDLAALRTARDLDALATETGIPMARLAEAQAVLTQLDEGEARVQAEERTRAIESSHVLAR